MKKEMKVDASVIASVNRMLLLLLWRMLMRKIIIIWGAPYYRYRYGYGDTHLVEDGEGDAEDAGGDEADEVVRGPLTTPTRPPSPRQSRAANGKGG